MNFYEVLNIKQVATDKEIKKAYRLLAKKYHPDTYSGDKLVAEQKMREINVAYETLSNPDLRKSYDEKIGVNSIDSETKYHNENSYSKAEYYTNRYNKSGVNYEVKYRPNNSRIRYNSRGYAESNYYTSGIDEEEYYEKYNSNFRKAKLKELLTGKNLIYTLICTAIIIGIFSLMIYKAFESISEFISSTYAISEKINNSKEETAKNNEQQINELKKKATEKVEEAKENVYPAIENFFDELKNKEQEAINNYKKESEGKNKEEILEDWGITDKEAQKEILNLIEQLNKN